MIIILGVTDCHIDIEFDEFRYLVPPPNNLRNDDNLDLRYPGPPARVGLGFRRRDLVPGTFLVTLRDKFPEVRNEIWNVTVEEVQARTSVWYCSPCIGLRIPYRFPVDKQSLHLPYLHIRPHRYEYVPTIPGPVSVSTLLFPSHPVSRSKGVRWYETVS